MVETMEDSEVQIDKNLVVLADMLDYGGEGEIYNGKYKGIEVVIKRYNKEDSNYLKEITAYRKLNHEFMVKYYGYFIDSDNLVNLVLEKAAGTALQEFAISDNDEDSLTYEEKLKILHQICEFLIYLRKNHVIHRDLKPDNINVYKDILTNQLKIKLLDFGITKISNNTLTSTRNSLFTTHYSSPELYYTEADDKKLSYKLDIWAFGCIASFLFTGFTPWTNKSKNPIKIQVYLVQKEKFPIPENCDIRIVPLIQLCTKTSPEDRPNPQTIQYILNSLLAGENMNNIEDQLEESNYI